MFKQTNDHHFHSFECEAFGDRNDNEILENIYFTF